MIKVVHFGLNRDQIDELGDLDRRIETACGRDLADEAS
jgi:hypothetical protein